ncbi:S-phase kinase-associated protein 1 [Orchesella cincta]|uniref:S-phase kinase-associated protein 1 n=1 Tax=Orchesella cincta TaxID=48709 RepID=A0A1D2M382_ORCCI|nr:S-phase kinase-associated protein 1 [Orchesella cincta]
MPNIKLVAKDDGITEVDLEVVKKSITIKSLLENADTPTEEQEEELIPVPNVTTPILRKVVEWMIHHKDDALPVDENNEDNQVEMSRWDEQFFKAANYLDIKGLLVLTAMKAAEIIKTTRTAEKLRKILKIPNEFSPEHEERIRRENEWCMEK